MDEEAELNRRANRPWLKARSWLEFVGAGATVYALITAAPTLGRVVESAFEDAKTMLLAEQTPKPGVRPGIMIGQIPEAKDHADVAATTRLGRRYGLSAALARAVAVVASDGRVVGAGRHYDVSITPNARASFAQVDVLVPSVRATAAAREAALIRGVGRLSSLLGSMEAAVAALAIDLEDVKGALNRSRAVEKRYPDRYQTFRDYLPRSARRMADRLVPRTFALATGFDMQWPVQEGARVSSGFGMRLHPVHGRRSMHSGTDLAVDPGTKIWAMADGSVVFASWDVINGYFVKIDHGNGLTSAYCHASRLRVKRGQRIRKGQVIALSGDTGRATGPHLHFQVEIAGNPVDPEAFRARKAPKAHRLSLEAEAIGEAKIPRHHHHH